MFHGDIGHRDARSLTPLQFVAESTPNRDENAIVCSPAVKRSSSAQKSRNVKHVRHHARFHVGSPTHISSSIGDRVTEAGWSESSPAGPPQLSPSSQTSFDEHYEESAAQGLLALGHSTIENIPTDTNTSTSIYHSLEDTHPSGTVDISSAVSSGHLDHLDSIDSDQILEFLKHFRYEVAPWVSLTEDEKLYRAN
ncbi:hypothetical protein Plec18167_004568 [Paecilomyces lecythidis]|uniref:Uncharacterized protein n=1 Tax=Paecilomyces lecythidis TaxID=3004212 RepID=A0ABR3XSF2_9EURO